MGNSARTARVVGLGLCVRDEVLLVDDFALSEQRIRYRRRLCLPGGMVANALAAVAAEGVEAHLLSMVGRDRDGEFVSRGLRRRGVVTRRLTRSEEHPTTTALVLVERGTGRRRFIVPDRRAMERHAPEFDLAPIRGGTVLMVDGHFPGQALRATRKARDCGATVVADFADARAAFRRLLPHIDYPVVPLDFVRDYGEGGVKQTLLALHRRYGGTPVVTLGEKGALALHGGQFLKVPPVRVRVVDTTGAGDVFHGAFSAGLALGLDVASALRRAGRSAAASCRHLGGMPPEG